ncbi:MAG: T9SS type A sorting domain-containing protein [Candidatus Aegiribacteria sp.]|nr:T9SS type A sorting domain-containing protein [Candidatus Aegiribacteria sp.]
MNEPCAAVLSIYDVSGRLIDTLVNAELSGGDYSINIDAADMTAGLYMVRLQAGGNVSTGRFILLR